MKLLKFDLEPRLARESIDFMRTVAVEYGKRLAQITQNVADWNDHNAPIRTADDEKMESCLNDILFLLHDIKGTCSIYEQARKRKEAEILELRKEMKFDTRFVFDENEGRMVEISVQEAADRQGMGMVEYLAYEAEHIFKEEEETISEEEADTGNKEDDVQQQIDIDFGAETRV